MIKNDVRRWNKKENGKLDFRLVNEYEVVIWKLVDYSYMRKRGLV